MKFPATLVRAVLLAAAVASLAAHAQPAPAAASALPQFDVISVKPNNTSEGAHGLVVTEFTADGFRGSNVPVHVLLLEAYGLHEGELLNEPSWAQSAVFDIDAKVAGPDVAAYKRLNQDQRQAMFQQILAERFHFTAHRQTRDLPVYALSVARTGSKLKQSAPDPANPVGSKGAGRFAMSSGRIDARGTSIAYFVGMLSRQLGRTVVDSTGLTGNYDFTLQWTPDNRTPSPDSDAPPSIFTAVQEQLGLRLESTKAPLDALVIDRLDPPTEN